MIRTTSVALALTIALLFAGSPRAGAADLLVNGGFEQGPDGWSSSAGQLDTVSSPVYAGALSGRFIGGSQPMTQSVYQWVSVRAGENYDLSGWIAASGGNLKRVFLRVSWYDEAGQLLIEWDSDWLPQFDGAFYRLGTGARVSLSAARSARVAAIVQADSLFTLNLDDLVLAGPPAPTSTTTPPPTPQITTVPTPSPVRSSPTPVPLPSRTPPPPPTQPSVPEPTAAGGEPLQFPHLVNGSFEELRDDGTPYGWRKQGGEMSSVSEPRTDSSRSLALNSQTSSTKWAYQTVSVAGGAYYRASVDAYGGDGTDAVFIRVSWYASADGGGPALSSVDSVDSSTPADGAFRRLVTAAVQAPAGAASAKLRLMLRPLSDQPAIAYYDSATFLAAEPGVFAPGAEEVVLGPARSGPRGGSGNAGALASGRSVEAAETSTAAGGSPMPARLANIKPAATSGPVNAAVAGGGEEGWAIVLAIGVAVATIAIAGSYELWQRRIARRHEGTLPHD